MSNDIRIYDANIASLNGRIDATMIEIRRKLTENPDVNISDLLKMMLNYDSSRRIAIWEKEKLCHNACERFAGKEKRDALA